MSTKGIAMVLTIMAVMAGITMASPGPVPAGVPSPTNHPEHLTVPTNLWFHIGEQLVYRVYWGRIPVGTTWISTEWREINSIKCIAIRYRTLSNKIIDTLYPVDDLIEAIIDPQTFRPITFTKRLNEGKHRYHEVTSFDFTNHMARWHSLISGKTKTFPLEEDTRDLVTFMYLLRAQTFTAGSNHYFRVMADQKVYDLWLKIAARDSVHLESFGAIPSFRFEPEAAFQGFFVRKGKLTAWVSDDSRKICTRIVATVPVANINVLLWEVHGPGNDSWITETRRRMIAERK